MDKMVRIIPLGGANEIGSNCYYIDWRGEYKFLLDCGALGDGTYIENLPEFDKADTNVDAIIISHSHNDHIGAIPFAEKYFLNSNGKIYLTNITKGLSKCILEDIGRIMEKDKEDKFTDIQKSLYDYDNIDRIIKEKMKGVEYNKKIEIFPGLYLTFFDAGHVFGSACVYLEDEDIKFLYTGDFNLSDSFLHNGIQIPKDIKVDILLSEGTYGAKTDKKINLHNKVKKVADLIKNAQENDAYIMFPVFALGRAQEIMCAIKKAMDDDLISKNTTINISKGLCEKLTNIYKNHFDLPEYNVAKYFDEPVPGEVYILTNGFFSLGSPARNFAEFVDPLDKGMIIFSSSYVFNRKEIQEWIKNSKWHCECIDFSAHASGSEIRSFIERINPEITILVHGSIDNLIPLGKYLEKNKRKYIIPEENGEELILRKIRNKIEYVRSSNTKCCVITVGTSLLSKGKEIELIDDNIAKLNSAELNTLFSINKKERKNSIYHLICTNKSYIAGKKINDYLCKKNYTSVLHKVDFDIDEGKLKSRAEMKDIISIISKILLRYPSSIIVATGGFKFETAYAFLLGNIYGSKVYYKHEDMHPDCKAILLEHLPINIDFSLYSYYSEIIEEIFQSNTDRVNKLYEELPDSIKNLIYKYKDNYFLTNIGSILYYAVKRNRDFMFEKLQFQTDSYNHYLFDFEKEGNRIKVKTFKNIKFGNLIFSLCLDEFVEKITFKKLKKFESEETEKTEIFTLYFKGSTNKKIVLGLNTIDLHQDIEIKVKAFPEHIIEKYNLRRIEF